MKGSKSTLLVLIQLVALFYIFFTGEVIPTYSISLALLLGGVFLSVWAFYALRTTKFSLLPEVPESAALVTGGPYKLIRHPMYLGIMLIATALVFNDYSLERFIALIILHVVLLVKTNIEEKYLDKHFKEYGTYKAQTKKLIPYLY
ncbi:MAG TPA: isoprenylcysteine carboxylmethyltransferase family protein [Candidatus Levybacteria bacterium]|nr:isoprenylcysteine carboxylmethyltransferase family protein [Candidatus Levybacteria bacterium]